jgi:hypothetical protein
MKDQFVFLGDKHKAAIAAISLGVLLLLPASLGFGGTIIQEAFGQFNLPLLEEEEAAEETEEENGGLTVEEEETTTTPPATTPPATTPPATTPPATTPPATTDIQDPSAYMLAEVNVVPVRGFIGSTLPTQGAGGNAVSPADDSGHIVTGRFRLFANDTLVRRFVAEMNVAAIDGSSFHNITIQEGPPHRFEVTQGNGTTAANQAVSSIVGRVFLNGGATPVIDNVPMTLAIRGQSLALEDIEIDETRITDPGQRDIISVIDGQSIYGTIPRV